MDIAALVGAEDRLPVADGRSHAGALDAGDAAFPELLPGGGLDAGDDAGVVPEVALLADDENAGDVGDVALDAPGLVELPGIVDAHGDALFGIGGEAAGADDEVAMDDGRADGALVGGEVEDAFFRNDGAVGGIDDGEAVLPVGEDEQVASAALNDAGDGVADAFAVAGDGPFDRAGVGIDGEEVPFLILLVVVEDDEVAEQHGGGAETVASGDGAEVADPELFPGMIEGGHGEPLGGAPGEDDAFAIDGGGGGGGAVEAVSREIASAQFGLPDHGAVAGAEAVRHPALGGGCGGLSIGGGGGLGFAFLFAFALGGGFGGAEDKEPVTPDRGGAVADAGKIDGPALLRGGPGGRDGDRAHGAATVRSPEARPVVVGGEEGKAAREQGGEQAADGGRGAGHRVETATVAMSCDRAWVRAILAERSQARMART